MIYSTEQNENYCMSEERSNRRIEETFVKEICDLVMDTLEINYNEKRIVRPLLEKVIGPKIHNRYKELGLLEQYEAYVLDTAVKRLKDDCGIQSSVNHSNATHAKLADIATEISKKLEKSGRF
jgi:hypothetical protein